MITQPPSGPPNPFDLGNYEVASTLIWIQIIIAAIFAFFMLVEYINTRKTYHLLWAASFITIWIVFHQVASSTIGSFELLDDSVIAGLSAFIPGAIAAGLIYSVYEGKKLKDRVSYGQLYLVLTLIMSVAIGILSSVYIRTAILDSYTEDITYIPRILTMIFNIVNAIVIIGLPIYTTMKTKETTRSAYLIAVGGILMSIQGIFFALTLAEISAEGSFIFMGLTPYLLLFSTAFYAFGMLYEKKWRFNIPGVEFED
jgi:hypothetical protein